MENTAYKDDEQHIIKMCKRIRHLAKLDMIRIDTSEHPDNRTIHLSEYLDFCCVSKEVFVNSYLSNLQPYMLSVENTLCVLNTIYGVSLYIKTDTSFEKEVVVSFHETRKDDIVKDNYLNIKNAQDKTKILADAITGGVKNTNTKTFDILIPRGIINIPVSLVGELQEDGTFLVSKKTIDNAILSVFNNYIEDLYSSSLDLSALDEVEIYSVLQQTSYTPYGNSVFSNISLLIDNMFAQDSPLHKNCAAFALETYTGQLIMTPEQKDELIGLITDKCKSSYNKDIDKVKNMLIDIIDNIEPEKLILDEVLRQRIEDIIYIEAKKYQLEKDIIIIRRDEVYQIFGHNITVPQEVIDHFYQVMQNPLSLNRLTGYVLAAINRHSEKDYSDDQLSRYACDECERELSMYEDK